MHVNFNFQVDPDGNPRPEQRFAVAALTEHRINDLDFAILQLGVILLRPSGPPPLPPLIQPRSICYVSSGHPAGVPKRIEAGPLTELSGTQIRYNDIDTLGGNSGSAIWHSQSGTIVGVHTNGGCTTFGGFNFGVRISSLRDASPTLQVLTQQWEYLGGIFTSPPAVTSWGPERLDIFGLGQGGGMFHKAWEGSRWRP